MTVGLSGFGNALASEARPGALPKGQNSPQKTPFGLFAEQISATAFTAPRAENRRSWLYRVRPSADHPAYVPFEGSSRLQPGLQSGLATPNRLRWDPAPVDPAADFVEGLVTYAQAGNPADGAGLAIHLYTAGRSMQGRALASADGEWLIVPEQGVLRLFTEFGVLETGPGEIALIPRGVRFRVELIDTVARGYVCENYGALFRLPELGPIGANGLAEARDFRAPQSAYEAAEPHEIVLKHGGRLWSTRLDRSPFDVVAWRGNLWPFAYDLAAFNAMGTVSFDHPDPSIFTVLTSPSQTPGVANVDFVIFPLRWSVAEHTFRPPWFHRNLMSEFMGLVTGAYEAKRDGFAPGGASLHPSMSAHGPDAAAHAAAVSATLAPERIEGTLAFMFESRMALRPTDFALSTPLLQADYDACWTGYPSADLDR